MTAVAETALTTEELAEIDELEKDLAPKQVESRPQRAKITHHDAREVARLVSEYHLTETEACSRLEITQKQWFNWKLRNKHKEQFEAMFTKCKQAVIVHNIQNIKDTANGIGVKQRDWRASEFLLKVTDRERFGTEKPIASQPQSTVNIMVMSDALNKLLPAPIEIKSLPPSPEASQA